MRMRCEDKAGGKEKHGVRQVIKFNIYLIATARRDHRKGDGFMTMGAFG